MIGHFNKTVGLVFEFRLVHIYTTAIGCIKTRNLNGCIIPDVKITFMVKINGVLFCIEWICKSNIAIIKNQIRVIN